MGNSSVTTHKKGRNTFTRKTYNNTTKDVWRIDQVILFGDTRSTDSHQRLVGGIRTLECWENLDGVKGIQEKLTRSRGSHTFEPIPWHK